MDVTCPYCNKKAKFVDSKKIYGKSYGMIYACFASDCLKVGIIKEMEVSCV